MQLTLRQFFDKFPMLKQAAFANLCAMQYITLHQTIKGAAMSREQLALMQDALQRFARELGEVELTHDNFQKERKPFTKNAK